MKTLPITSCLLLLLSACSMPLPTLKKEEAPVYFFDAPAQRWEETLPLGNGRIGLMPDGGIRKETWVLNEISLWSGGPQAADNPKANIYLPAIRKLLFAGKNDQAQALMYQHFICQGQGSANGAAAKAPYGCYQTLGKLWVDYAYPPPADAAVSNYRRELNLQTAIATTSFRRGTLHYKRESFTSFGSDLGVIRLSVSHKGALSFTAGLSRPEHCHLDKTGNDLLMEGQLTNGVDSLGGLKYAARLRILLPQGGSLTATDSCLHVQGATEAVLLLSMATNYFGQDPAQHNAELLEAASQKDYPTLRREQIAAYGRLFKRVSLDLGHSLRESWPINRRLAAFHLDGDDPSLPALYFQFGRYLLISSTRPGLLPPNLQGLWANSVQTPWNGDYHLNINLEMNLWPSEVTNLAELRLPMLEWALTRATRLSAPNWPENAPA
jgi:alpha-L-fucosidase 2